MELSRWKFQGANYGINDTVYRETLKIKQVCVQLRLKYSIHKSLTKSGYSNKMPVMFTL